MGNKNKGVGSESDLGVALAKAKESGKRSEVKSRRTSSRSTFANPDGTVTDETAQTPVRAENDRGDLVPIDTSLRSEGGRLVPEAVSNDVSFSADGDGALATYEPAGGTSLSLTYASNVGRAAVEGSKATYDVDGSDDESVSVAATSDGLSTQVVLDTMPDTASGAPTYSYDFTVKGLQAELDGQVLTFSNAKGDVVAQTRPLEMWDAARDEAGDPSNVQSVDASLENTASGVRLNLVPSVDFLADPKTVYPVVVDPVISPVTQEGDTFYYSDQPSSDHRAGDYRLRTGRVGSRTYRSLVTFAYKAYRGQVVTAASLRLRQYYAPTCTPKSTDALPVTADRSSYINWSNRPAVSTDARFKTMGLFNSGNTQCQDAFASLDVTPMVNAWAGSVLDGDTAGQGRQGIELRASNEAEASNEKRFCSVNLSGDPSANCNDPGWVPVLSVTYAADLGKQSWYSMTDHQLGDKSSVSVNNKNGNLLAQSGDVDINGLGLDTSVGRAYNSQSGEKSSLGQGWALTLGPDVYLERKSAYRFDYHAPGGTVLGSFIRKSSSTGSADYNEFTTPTGGSRADLSQSGTQLTLKFHGSQKKYVFNTSMSTDGNAYLKLVKDRSDNQITINYPTTSTGRPKMTSIQHDGASASTPDSVVQVTYGTGATASMVTKLSHTFAMTSGPNSPTTTRTWTYAYADGRLSAYQDPDGKSTMYQYSSDANLLAKITDPVNSSGASPTTSVAYGFDDGLQVNQVSEVSYQYGSASGDHYDYTWDYRTGEGQRPARCDGSGSNFSVVTDPNDNDTTYCYRSRNDAGGNDKTWVYDGLGNARSTEYSADNGPVNITSPTGQSTSGGGSTVATYSNNFPDRVDSITEPKNTAGSSNTSSSAGFEYSNSTSVAGGSYLPTAVNNTSKDCNRYGYDDQGRTTTAYSGITPNLSTGVCGSASGADAEYHVAYNDNGTIKETRDGNAGASPTTADKTIYTYWASGDTGFVAGITGQVKSIRKPGGDCATGTGRKLCTSFTYDGAARVASITDGRGIVTNYAYDNNDRTTAVHFNNGNNTTCLLGLSTCLKYTYDAEGNLTQRAGAETTTFSHDRLNRMIQQSVPSETLGANDVIGLAYDGTGNLTSFAQTLAAATATHTVTYGYDAANRLNRVTEGGEDITISTDDDGRTQSITYPKPAGTSGARVEYDYFGNGKPKQQRIETHAGAETAKISYDYDKVISILGISVTIDTPQLQSRKVTQSTFADQKGTTDYVYSKQRLTSATDSNGPNYTYEYDKIGNLTQDAAGGTTTNYGYSKAGELCWRGASTGTKLAQTCPSTPSGNTTIEHDAAGNSLGSSTNSYTVNDRNQVTDIDDTAMTYTDQGNDLRANNGTTREINSPLGISAVRKGSTITYLVRDPSGTILSTRTGTTRTNFVTEPNGNATWLLNPAGTQIAGYKYAPYGGTDTYGGATADNNRFRWLGAPQNTTSTGDNGHYKLGARYYDTHAHFTQPDPIAGGIGDPRTMTSYNYAGGDPINQADPSGNYFGTIVKYAVAGYSAYAAGESVSKAVAAAAGGDLREAGGLVTSLAVGSVVTAGCGYAVGAATLGVGAVYCAGVGAYAGSGAYNYITTGSVAGV